MSLRDLPRKTSLERRIKHYSNLQQILLVGEGDFSFSLALAKAFGSAKNMVSTSLDTREEVLRSYCSAPKTLKHLKGCGATVLHGVDATVMNKLQILRRRMFDRIVFNFPHAGLSGSEWDEEVIKKHRHLVDMFFKNARTMLSKTGEIHVTHKVGEPYSKWELVEQAQKGGLDLKEYAEFHIEDYPGYVNRRGARTKMGRTFKLGECHTYMFIIGSAFRDSFPKHCEEKKSAAMSKMLEKYPTSLKAVALQLESEKMLRKAAENARVDMEVKFSQLMTLTEAALDERDEFKRQRDNALLQKDQIWREKENIAKQLGETLRLKEDEAMQRDVSILKLESERRARIDAESARDEFRSMKDEAVREKTKVTKQLAEALRMEEDAINERDMSMLNLKFERQARKAAEAAKVGTEDLVKTYKFKKRACKRRK